MAAHTQRDARSAWVSPYAFELRNGGLGVALSCSGTSSSIELVGAGNAIVITNTGDYWVWVAWGGSTIAATTSYFPIPPGEQLTVTLPQDDSAATTHVAGITTGGTSLLNVHRGEGV